MFSVRRCVAVISILLCAGVTTMAETSAQAKAFPPKSSKDQSGWAILQAKIWLRYFREANIENQAVLSEQVKHELSRQMLKSESMRLRRLGTPLNFSFLGSGAVTGGTGYYVLIQFKSSRVVEALAYNDQGQIIGIDFKELDQTVRPTQ